MFDFMDPNAVYLRKDAPLGEDADYGAEEDSDTVKKYQYRLLATVDNGYIFINIYHPNALPQLIEFAQIDKERAKGVIVEIDDPWAETVNRHFSPDHDYVALRDSNFVKIKPIVTHPEFFKPKVRAGIITVLLASEDTAKSTYYRYSRRYWQRGQTLNALLPDFAKCGAKGEKRSPSTEGLNNSEKTSTSKGVELTPEIKDMMHSAVMNTIMSKRYRVNKKGKQQNLFDVPAAYADFLLRYCKGDTKLLDDNKPSLDSFKKYYYEIFTEEQRAQAKHGGKYFSANTRATTSTVREANIGGEVDIIIDSTPFDLGAANQNRFPLGRATLYAASESFSSAIVGFWLVLTPPSYFNAVNCMTIAVSNKRKFLAQFGMEDLAEKWVMEGVPNSFFMDLGSEFKTKNIEQFVSVYHRSIKNSGAGQPDKRAVGEKVFDRIHREILPNVPGVVSEVFSKKSGGKTSQDEYTMLLSELNKLLIRAVITLNNKPLAKWDPDVDFPSGLAKTPNNIWQWRFGGRGGLLPKVDQEFFKFSMLKREDATVSNNLLRIDKVQFVCPTFSGIRLKKKNQPKKVKIVRFMDDASAIYLVPEEGQTEYIRCEISPHYRRFKGIPWTDVIASLKVETHTHKVAMHEHHVDKVEDLIYAKDLTSKAVEDRQQKVGKLSKAERLRLYGDKSEKRIESAETYRDLKPSNDDPQKEETDVIKQTDIFVSKSNFFMDEED